MNTIYCNPKRSDGFGAQFQNIIWTYIYCKINNYEFYYQAFSKIEHNYDNDKFFIKKKEDFINFLNSFKLADSNISELNTKICYNFIEKNINTDDFINNLNVIKNIFYKNKINPFNNNYLNIAIHIRRPNKCDNRIEGANTENSYYLNIINYLLKKYCIKSIKIHIFSQGNIDSFKDFERDNVIFHLNESIEKTFLSFCFANILVTSASSFSYTAALLNNNEIYYTKFWHLPFNNWNII